MQRPLETAEVAQPVPETAAATDDYWSELGGVAFAIVVLAFAIPYVLLAIRRFEKQQLP